jgi:hypothetical protein
MIRSVRETPVELYCPRCDRSFGDDGDHCPEDGTRLVRLTGDPLIGHLLDGRFRIDSKLGAGGTGTVYRAYQKSIGRDVAIKVIRARISQGTQTAKPFLREAKRCSRLSQPNIVTVLDFGQSDDGLLYLVMELLAGRTLRQVLEEDGPLSTRRVVGIGVQLCDALEAAHSLSIVHRDLKPSNVVVLDDPPGRDYLKVLDFGLTRSLVEDSSTATLTQSDVILGTPAYISPEAVLGRCTDERSDLYSLGVMLYELVAGRLPYRATNVNMMLSCHASQAPDRIGEGVAAPLRELIMSLLDKDPLRRPASAAAIREALEPLAALADPPARRSAESGSIAVGPAAAAAATEDTARGRPWLLRGTAAVATLAVAAGLWWFQSRSVPGAAPGPDAAAIPAVLDAGGAIAIDDAAPAPALPSPIDAAPERGEPPPALEGADARPRPARPARTRRDAAADDASEPPDPRPTTDTGTTDAGINESEPANPSLITDAGVAAE